MRTCPDVKARLCGVGQLEELHNGIILSGLCRARHAHVVIMLQVEPELRSDSKGGRETDRGIRSDAAPAFDQIIDAADTDTRGLRKAQLANFGGLQEFEKQQLSGMGWSWDCGFLFGGCLGFGGAHIVGWCVLMKTDSD